MSTHQRFNFKKRDSFRQKVNELKLSIPFKCSIDPLFYPLDINGNKAPNRMLVQPMEGFDSNADGTPGELTLRRYQRYARGGSGTIWFEATAVTRDGRSNPHQLLLDKTTAGEFKRLVDSTRSAAKDEFESDPPLLILQITHSGRYAKPNGKSLGKVTCYNPFLDNSSEGLTFFSDVELDSLRETLSSAVELAFESGFDGVDIKACHGYLLHEFLSAHKRTDSRYGGVFENRIRFLVDTVQNASAKFPDKIIAVRMNATDGLPWPWGFGVRENGGTDPDLSEPRALIHKLILAGCNLLNITVGIPYITPQMVRPFDRPVRGTPTPEEHPLLGVARMIGITAEFQAEFPEIPIVGSGYSWLRQFWPNVGSAVLENNMASFIGIGRGSFAYPDAPLDLMNLGSLDPRKNCITCSGCTELMRQGKNTGCVIRDKNVYGKSYGEIMSAS